MNDFTPPAALVLGCNTPHGIGVLSDWIEERTGHVPDFHGGGWSNDWSWGIPTDGDGRDDGFGNGRGSGFGHGHRYFYTYRGDGHGAGVGDSDGVGDGYPRYGDSYGGGESTGQE